MPAALDNCPEIGRHLATVWNRSDPAAVHRHDEPLHLIGRVSDQPFAEHLEQHHGDAEDVGAESVLKVEANLGRHVQLLADPRVRHRRLDHLRHAEVGDFRDHRVSRSEHEDVLGLDVSMDHLQ